MYHTYYYDHFNYLSYIVGLDDSHNIVRFTCEAIVSQRSVWLEKNNNVTLFNISVVGWTHYFKFHFYRAFSFIFIPCWFFTTLQSKEYQWVMKRHRWLVLGIWTQGCRIVCTDEFIGLRAHVPFNTFFITRSNEEWTTETRASFRSLDRNPLLKMEQIL